MSRAVCDCSRCQLLLLILSALLLSSEAQLTWQLVDDGTSGVPVPVPRRDAAIGHDGTLNKLVLFGGRTLRNGITVVLGDTMIYDLSKGMWRRVTPATSPQPRFAMVYGSSGSYFYVATGQGHNGVFYSDIWRFDMRLEKWFKLPVQNRPSYYTADHWAALEKLSPQARYSAGGGIFANGSEFYVSLGSSERQYGDTYSYRIEEMGWYLVSPDKGPYQPSTPHARSLHAAAMISRSEILIFGGCLSGGQTGGPCPTADSWLFDARTLKWKKLPTCASARTMAALALLPIVNEQRRVILYGGEEEGPGYNVIRTVKSRKEEVGVFNPDTQSWMLRRTSGDIPAKRSSVSMVTGNRGIYMFGGYDVERGEVTNSLYKLLGNSSSADSSPVLAQCFPTQFNLIMLHGVLMGLASGLFLPWGAFIVRFLRKNDHLRHNLHKLFEIFGMLLSVAGFVCGVLSVINNHFTFVHAIVGLTTTVVGLSQPLNVCLRPSRRKKPGDKMASRYFLWKLVHVFLGRVAIVLGLANVSVGLFLAQSSRVIWIAWFAYLGLLLLCHVFAELSGRRGGRPGSSPSNEQTNSHESAMYVVTGVIPASELPRVMFESINKREQSL